MPHPARRSDPHRLRPLRDPEPTSSAATRGSTVRNERTRLSGWLNAIARGDQRAMRELFDATHARVHRIAFAVLRDATDAEDVVVEVFEQVWKRAGAFDAEQGDGYAWLSVIARSRAIDRVRKRRRENAVTLEESHADGLVSLELTPSVALEGREQGARVHAALERLPAVQRQALQAAFFDGLSHAEVASALAIPLGTAKTRIRGGLLQLRAILESEEVCDDRGL